MLFTGELISWEPSCNDDGLYSIFLFVQVYLALWLFKFQFLFIYCSISILILLHSAHGALIGLSSTHIIIPLERLSEHILLRTYLTYVSQSIGLTVNNIFCDIFMHFSPWLRLHRDLCIPGTYWAAPEARHLFNVFNSLLITHGHMQCIICLLLSGFQFMLSVFQFMLITLIVAVHFSLCLFAFQY